MLYEGYGPGGVALLIEAFTDNRNRTGADVRHLLSKHGGNLGEPGSVSYLFDKQGVIVVDATRYDEDDLIAGDRRRRAGHRARRRRLRGDHRAGRPRARSAPRCTEAGRRDRERRRRPAPASRGSRCEEADAAKLMKLIDALEEFDDVSAVHANFDVDADVLERIAG